LFVCDTIFAVFQYNYEDNAEDSLDSADHFPLATEEEEESAVTDSVPIDDDIHNHHHQLPLGMAILTLLGRLDFKVDLFYLYFCHDETLLCKMIIKKILQVLFFF
jgi:hypothetical protein